MNTCPPNMLCIEYSHTIFIIVLIFIFIFYVYTRYQNVYTKNKYLVKIVKDKSNCNTNNTNNTSNIDNTNNNISNNLAVKNYIEEKYLEKQLNKNDLYDSVREKLNIKKTNNDIFEEPTKTVDGVRVNIATRGPTPEISQLGILSKLDNTNNSGPGSDAEAHVLPLLGRRTYNRSNKFVYYTATDKYNQVRIPISHNGRDCGGEYGCDEIMNGDTITIPELNGTFKVKIYENTSLHYIPY
jgi:hypothetical protein